MSTRFDPSSTPVVDRQDELVVITLSQGEAQLLAATLWLATAGDADQLTWLDTIAERVSDAARAHGAEPFADLAVARPRETDVERRAPRAGEAAAVRAAEVVERAVEVAADQAKAAALAARRARAAATTTAASLVAATVRQQASAVQEHAEAEARLVAAAAARAASRVASAVLRGHEFEAKRTAVLVAEVTTEAAAATAERTALLAAATARDAAAAALQAAAAAADAALLVELEVQSTAEATQDVADAAATQLRGATRNSGELISC